MTAPSSSKTRRTTITPTALHHYRGRNYRLTQTSGTGLAEHRILSLPGSSDRMR
jgi:hypothetical protein